MGIFLILFRKILVFGQPARQEIKIKKWANPLQIRGIADKTEVSVKASADSEPRPSTPVALLNK